MKYTELETPCFIIDENQMEDNVCQFQNALNNFYDHNILSYSVKTNSIACIVRKMKEFGCYAEVVSYDEYSLVRTMGFPVNKIIYNGPMKSKETFQEALLGGAYVNIETKREIEWLKDIPFYSEANLGIRVNINLSTISKEDAKEANDSSRFGFSYENGELRDAISTITENGYIIKGIHAHRTSKTRSLSVYKNICKYLNEIIKELELNLEYIDIGGGYYGDMPGKPTYFDYVNSISKSLSEELKNITIIVEPGNGLIASPVSYLSTVIDTKMIEGKQICVTDGSRNDVDPMFHKTDYCKEIIYYGKNDIENEQIITGCTCLENDKLFVLTNAEKLQIGDKIYTKYVGAYTMTLSPNFIRLLPNVYMKKGEDYQLVRKKWTVNEWVQGDIKEN